MVAERVLLKVLPIYLRKDERIEAVLLINVHRMTWMDPSDR
jgi:hypothetical protein